MTGPVKPQDTTNYKLLGKGWATCMPVTQTLQSMHQTCPCTTTMCAYMFAQFPLSETFKPTSTSPVNNKLKQQCDSTSEISRTTIYELHGKDWATCMPFTQTLQSVCQTCPSTTTTCAYMFVQFPLSGTFKPTHTSPVETTS